LITWNGRWPAFKIAAKRRLQLSGRRPKAWTNGIKVRTIM
jgi:hypothetical protein